MCKETIDYVSAFLVPTIALITTYVAIQQYRLEGQRLKRDLYPDRLRVFQTIMQFLAHVAQNANASDEQLSRLISQTSEARFLFKGKIQEYIETLYKKGLDLQYVTRELRDGNVPQGEKRERLGQQNLELLGWFRKQFDEARNLFQKYLAFRA